MRLYKVEGIILKRSNFGEADRIVTVFTRNRGKLKVIAKGTRRITSRRGPNIELFNRVNLVLYRGRNFDNVTEAQVIDTYEHMRSNLELVGLAYYICELVEGLCAEQQPHEKIFEALVGTLTELDNGLIHTFEKTLLLELGFLPYNKVFQEFDASSYIENILERKLKTKRLLAKLT